jgi:hypothetical protein
MAAVLRGFIAIFAALFAFSSDPANAQSEFKDLTQELEQLRTQILVRTDRTFNLGATLDPKEQSIADRLGRIPGEFSSLIRRGRLEEARDLQKQVFELLPRSQQGFRNSINPTPAASPLTLRALHNTLMSIAQESAADTKLRTSLLEIVTAIVQNQSSMIGDPLRKRFLELLSLWTAASTVWRYETNMRQYAEQIPEPEKVAYRNFDAAYNRAFYTMMCERRFLPTKN